MSKLSAVAFVATSIFCLGVASIGSGGILDACSQYGLAGVTHAECRSFWSGVLGRHPTAQMKTMVAFAHVYARIEAALFLGLGSGSVYALLKLRGNPAAAVVHLMQAVFFSTASLIHAHNSGFLPFEQDPNVRPEGVPFVSFVFVTGLLASL